MLRNLPSFLISLLLLTAQPITASFFPPETRRPSPPTPPSSTSPSFAAPSQQQNAFTDLIALANNTFPSLLLPRGDVPCAGTPCGYWGQVCCGAGQACYTNALTQAACSPSVGAINAATGYWSYYTSTNTQTLTQVYSTWIPVATPAQTTTLYVPLVAQATTTQAAVNCNTFTSGIACGGICCSNGAYCVVAGQCGVAGYLTTTTTANTAGAPLRVTSSTLKTVTASINPTTTVGFLPAIATESVTLPSMSTSSGLSAAAIAGIVIGVIAAIILLMLICLFLCFRTIWDSIFGGGRDRRQGSRRKVTTEEWGGGYRQHGSRSDARSDYQGYGGGGYGGGGGDRPQRPQRPRKDNSGGGGLGFAALAAALAGLAGGMSYARRNKGDEKKGSGRRRQEKSESDFTDDSSYLTRSVEEERVFRNGREVTRDEFVRDSRRTRR